MSDFSDRRRKSREFGVLAKCESNLKSKNKIKDQDIDASHINTKFIISAANSLLEAFIEADTEKTGFISRRKVQQMMLDVFEGDMSENQASELLDYFDAEGGVLEFEDFLDLYRHIAGFICKRSDKCKELKFLKSDRQFRKEGSTRHNCTWIYPAPKEDN